MEVSNTIKGRRKELSFKELSIFLARNRDNNQQLFIHYCEDLDEERTKEFEEFKQQRRKGELNPDDYGDWYQNYDYKHQRESINYS